MQPSDNKTHRRLSEKQKHFVSILASHNFNILQAGQAAGYSKVYANTQLPTLCRTSEHLRSAIEKIQAESRKHALKTIDELRDELWENHRETKGLKQYTSSNRALELYGRTIGAYTDKQETVTTHQIAAPTTPTERKAWLLDQLELLKAQERAGTAIAGDVIENEPGFASKALNE